MTETGIPDSSSPPRKRTRADDEVENAEKPSAEALPEPKRPNSSGGAAAPAPHDADLMALLERIDNMDNNNYTYLEHQQDQRLCGVMKSLAEEVGLKHQDPSTGDSSPDAGGDLQASAVDRSGDIMAGEFNFFLDAADDDRYAMNHFSCIDHYAAPYSQAWAPDDVDYAEVAEFFHGSLWEDDIWQPQDVSEIPQPL